METKKVKVTKRQVQNLKKKVGKRSIARPSRSIGASSSSSTAYVARSTLIRNLGPKYGPTSTRGDISVSSTEYVGTIAGSTTLNVLNYSINPGNPILFPWLSTIATRYEKYLFTTLHFELKARCPTTVTGTQVLAVDYDASDVAPSSMVQARSYRSSAAAVPWMDLMHNCVREDLGPLRYVRNGAALAANSDVKLYDAGNLFVIREGQAATDIVSELLVTYSIKLITPQMDSNPALSAFVVGATGLTANVLFGTAGNLYPGSSLPLTINTVGDTLTFLTTGAFTVTHTAIGTVFGAGAMTTVGSTVNVTSNVGTTDAGALNRVTTFNLLVVAGQIFMPKLASATTVTGSTFKVTPWFQ